MKTKREKLKEVLRVMKGESIDFSAFDMAVAELRKNLEEKVAIPTIEKVDSELEKWKGKLDLTPLYTSLEEVKKGVNTKLTELYTRLETRIKEQEIAMKDSDENLDRNFNNQLSTEINGLRVQIAGLDTVSGKQLTDLEKQIKDLDEVTKKTIAKIPDRESEIQDLNDRLNKTRIDLLNRIGERGGGGINRQMFIGNADPLIKYNDMNLKAGSNMTITYVNNNTTKKVDVTFSSSGGGSVGGTVRQIQTVGVSSTIGTLAGTDQVYLCNQGIQLVLPAASGDTNLYTIKNVSNSSILVVGTIDNDANGVIMPVKYTSIDIISNDTNWNIT